MIGILERVGISRVLETMVGTPIAYYKLNNGSNINNSIIIDETSNYNGNNWGGIVNVIGKFGKCYAYTSGAIFSKLLPIVYCN